MIPADIIDMLRQRDLYDVARRVARAHDCTVGELVGRSRHKGPAAARHALWAELYSRGHWSYPKLGELFGVDHSTVRDGVRAHCARFDIPMPKPRPGREFAPPLEANIPQVSE